MLMNDPDSGGSNTDFGKIFLGMKVLKEVT